MASTIKEPYRPPRPAVARGPAVPQATSAAASNPDVKVPPRDARLIRGLGMGFLRGVIIGAWGELGTEMITGDQVACRLRLLNRLTFRGLGLYSKSARVQHSLAGSPTWWGGGGFGGGGVGV